MKIKQIVFITILAWGGQVCIGQSIAPEIISSSGDSYSNTNGSLGWTIGEPIITTENNSNYYLTQGFQQPSPIIVTAISNTPSSQQENINVYPNPVSSSIYLQRKGNEQLNIQLLDMNGKLILSKVLSASDNQLDMNSLANGLYVLKVFDINNQFLQSVKLEKVK